MTRKYFFLYYHLKVYIDDLTENSNLSPEQVSATLLLLGLRGLVRQLSGKMYISNYGDEYN